MEEKQYQQAYREQSAELDQIQEEQKQQRCALKNMEENSQIASQLHKETLSFMEELNACWKEGSMSAFLQDQFDTIQADYRRTEQSRLKIFQDAQQNLKQLKERETNWEARGQKIKAEKEEQ